MPERYQLQDLPSEEQRSRAVAPVDHGNREAEATE